MALVNFNKKFIYIHIWKSGGTSMKDCLFQIPGTEEIGEYHDGISDIIEKYKSIDWSDFLKISIIRNPYDWYVSYWKYTTTLSNHWFHSYSLQIEFSEKFLDNKEFKSYSFLEFLNFIVYLKSIVEIKTAQVDFLTYNNKLNIDILIKLENINDGIKKIEKKLQFNIDEFPHLNKSDRESYSTYYNEECYSIVNILCEKDFKNLDYELITS